MIIYIFLLCALVAVITWLYQTYCYARRAASKKDLTEAENGCEDHCQEMVLLNMDPTDLLEYGAV